MVTEFRNPFFLIGPVFSYTLTVCGPWSPRPAGAVKATTHTDQTGRHLQPQAAPPPGPWGVCRGGPSILAPEVSEKT